MSNFAATTPGFCPNCGSILPLLSISGPVTCYTCQLDYPPEGVRFVIIFVVIFNWTHFYNFLTIVLGKMAVEYTIQFNSASTSKLVAASEDAEEGPIVERKCPKCGNDRMSYATLQLRSADEGQTVFFTCTKCKCVFVCECRSLIFDNGVLLVLFAGTKNRRIRRRNVCADMVPVYKENKATVFHLN